MATATADKNIKIAKKEIETVLKRYSLAWEDIAPDSDEYFWRGLKPLSKKVRRSLFRKTYPKLNAPKIKRG